MGSLILGLLFGFVFLAAFFFMPLLGVLFGAVVAGIIARGAGKGLIAGVGAGAIVGTVTYLLMGGGLSGGQVLIASGGTPKESLEYLGWVKTYLDDLGWLNILSLWHTTIIVCAVLGAIGGLIGGAIRKE